MRNRINTGVLSSPAPHLAGELQSNLCKYNVACMYVQSETSFYCLLLLFVMITAGDILQPPPATLLAGGFQSSLLYAICTKIISLLFICALE